MILQTIYPYGAPTGAFVRISTDKRGANPFVVGINRKGDGGEVRIYRYATLLGAMRDALLTVSDMSEDPHKVDRKAILEVLGMRE